MSTVVITFDFATDQQSFTPTAGANSVLSYDAAVGNPAGALKNRITGKNKSDADKWARTLTWEAMGVPVGSVITGVTSASMQSKCTEFTTGASSTSGAVTLVDGATTITLSSARSGIAATDANFVTTNGVDLTGLSLQSTDSCTITINSTLATGSSSSAAVTIYQDQLTYTVTYTALTTAALTGAAITSAAGTLAPSLTVPLTGKAITSAAGTLVSSIDTAISGSSATFASGSVSPSVDIPLTGGVGTFAAGTLVSDIQVPVSGQSASFSAGTVTAVAGGSTPAVALVVMGGGADWRSLTQDKVAQETLRRLIREEKAELKRVKRKIRLIETRPQKTEGALSNLVSLSIQAEDIGDRIGKLQLELSDLSPIISDIKRREDEEQDDIEAILWLS